MIGGICLEGASSLRYLLLLALAAESFNFVYLLVTEARGRCLNLQQKHQGVAEKDSEAVSACPDRLSTCKRCLRGTALSSYRW